MAREHSIRCPRRYDIDATCCCGFREKHISDLRAIAKWGIDGVADRITDGRLRPAGPHRTGYFVEEDE